MRKFVALAIMLALAGCAQSFQLQKAGRSSMWKSYSVATSEDINELVSEQAVAWSQYGPILEIVNFWKPVKEGAVLPFTYRAGNAAKAPKYRSGMSPEEIIEIYRTSVGLTGRVITATSRLQPIQIGAQQGYQFDMESSSPDGMDFKSRILFAVVVDELYLIDLTANATHYFTSRLPAFDMMVSTIEFNG